MVSHIFPKLSSQLGMFLIDLAYWPTQLMQSGCIAIALHHSCPLSSVYRTPGHMAHASENIYGTYICMLHRLVLVK